MTIFIRLLLKNSQLFIEIKNPYEGEINFSEGVPVSNRKNGGIGTRSIVQIAKIHSGLYDFKVSEGYFLLQIVI